MRKMILLGLALPLVFGLTMGFTVGMTDQAAAAPRCITCYYSGELQCTSMLAPKCPPNMPYKYAEFGACTPGGENNPYCNITTRGCCNANCFCIVWEIPEQ